MLHQLNYEYICALSWFNRLQIQMCRSFSVILFIYVFFCAFRDALYSYGHSVRFWGKVIFLHLSVILFTGGGSASVHAGRADPPKQTPLGRHPLGPDTPTRTRHPPRCRHPPTQCMLGDKANTRAVRILLECILVHIIFGLNYITSCAIQMHISNKRIGPIVSSNLVLFSKWRDFRPIRWIRWIGQTHPEWKEFNYSITQAQKTF